MMERMTLLMAGLIWIGGVSTGWAHVSLELEDRAGEGYDNEFVMSGVPFPIGLVRGELALQDDRGRDVPASIRPVVRWHDGSVKWAHVQMLATLEPGARAVYSLRSAGEPREITDPWRIEQADGSITVSNGMLEVRMATRGEEMLLGVRRDGDAVMSADGRPQLQFAADRTGPGRTDEENWLRDAPADAELTRAVGTVEAALLEERTPLRVVVRQDGGISGADGERMASFILRHILYRDSARMRVEFTLVFEYDTARYYMRECALRFPARLDGADVEFQGHRATIDRDRTGASLVATRPHVRVHQIRRDEVEPIALRVDALHRNGREKAAEIDRYDSGWVNVSTARTAFAVAAQRFAQRYPKEMSVAGDGLTYYVWPSSTGQLLDLRNYRWAHEPAENEGRRWEGPVVGRAEGTATTERLVFDFSGEPDGRRLAVRQSKRPLLVASPEYYMSTGVFGPILARDVEKYPQYEGVYEAALYWIMRSPDEFEWYGLLNDGGGLMEFNWAGVRGWPLVRDTWMCRGYSGWLMDDGGGAWMILQAFFRSGEFDYFDFAERRMNYVHDVSVIHADTEPMITASNHGRPSIGGSRRHNAQPWGDYVSSRGSNAYGVFFYYLLTGEPRAFDIIVQRIYFDWIYWSYENWTMVGTLSLGHELMKGMQGADPLFQARHRARVESLQRMRARAQDRGWQRCVQAANSYLQVENAIVQPDRLLARAGELLRTKSNPRDLDFVAETPLTEGVKYYELAQDPESAGGRQARDFLRTAADEVVAGRGTRNRYAPLFQGRAMVMAHDMNPDEGYLRFVRARLDELFPAAALRRVSLADGMPDGAAELEYMDLWRRISPFDANKVFHINGRILARVPYFLHCLERAERAERERAIERAR